jgi:hypothetical protein
MLGSIIIVLLFTLRSTHHEGGERGHVGPALGHCDPLVSCFFMVAGSPSFAQSEPWKAENGGVEPGKFVLGLRAGFAPLT